jgi:hypothetical protein
MKRDQDGFRKVRRSAGFCWIRGAWSSAPYPCLEQRPWTPRLIGGVPCFVACDTADLDAEGAFHRAKWCVVWDREAGPWFDDVGRLESYRDRPLYSVRADGPDGPRYHAILGASISQGFRHQIALDLRTEAVYARPLGTTPRPGDSGERLTWSPLPEM